MAVTSRRDFIKSGIVLASAAAVAPTLVQAPLVWGGPDAEGALTVQVSTAGANQPYETRSSARPTYSSVRVLDTERMPWERLPIWDRKVLFENAETKDHLMIIYVPPGWPGGAIHYHTFHEWAYGLAGDLTNNEYTSPDQRVGPLVQYREGYFLDRPPYSLHGGEKNRVDSQVGGLMLIMEEGGRTIGVSPGARGYSEEYKQVKQWAVPRLIDTIGMLPWEPEGSVPGLQVKRLVDDQSRGFRVIMRWLPTGWNSSQSSQFARPYFYKQAYQFNFVLSGELKIQTYKAPGEKAEQIALSKYFYVERAPMSIFGLADGVVSERGCVWLEATYARGTSISNAPIEAPNYV
jgi:hypothetical protein